MTDTKSPLFPQELLDQPIQARRAYFQAYTVAHPSLADVDQKVMGALREPGGTLLIFVVGPTGVGKSTFLARLEQRLIEQAMARMEVEPSHRPVVNIQAKVPASRDFRWGIFYTQGLLALQEPLLNYKIDPRASEASQRRRFTTPPRVMTGDADVLRLSWEQAVAHCHPAAILIDEAQHMGQAARNEKLLERLEHLKCLAISTNTVHILVGTYKLLAFRDLNAQLARRSIDIHFPRYQVMEKNERRAFKNVVLAFQRHLPLEEMPDLTSQWESCYTYTAGCVGLLKEWLMKALGEALEAGAKTISPTLLAHHAPSPARCDQMITEIEEGEGYFKRDDEAEDRLRARLGLSPRRKNTTSTPDHQGEEKPNATASSARPVGQRLPTHDPLKGGAEIHE
jgi:AAA domain